MNVKGWQKTTLIDYPEKIASTVFTAGCNFKCPYCHNKNLVIDNNTKSVCHEEIFEHLSKRSNVIDGVCISGGEPTLDKNLISFARKIKDRGLKVKLDTNGYCPEIIESMLKENLLDYIAMDVKNSEEKYAATVGLDHIDVEKIKTSIEIIKNSGIDYEFRTTVVKEFHDENDIINLGKMINGAKKVCIQKYNPNSDQIVGGFNYHKREELVNFKDILSNYANKVEIRGI